MRKLRRYFTPTRWRRVHFRLLGTGAFLLLLSLGLKGSPLDGIPVFAAMALIVLDIIGDILFFRCPVCDGFLWEFWSGYCHKCGEYIDFKRDA